MGLRLGDVRSGRVMEIMTGWRFGLGLRDWSVLDLLGPAKGLVSSWYRSFWWVRYGHNNIENALEIEMGVEDAQARYCLVEFDIWYV